MPRHIYSQYQWFLDQCKWPMWAWTSVWNWVFSYVMCGRKYLLCLPYKVVMSIKLSWELKKENYIFFFFSQIIYQGIEFCSLLCSLWGLSVNKTDKDPAIKAIYIPQCISIFHFLKNEVTFCSVVILPRNPTCKINKKEMGAGFKVLLAYPSSSFLVDFGSTVWKIQTFLHICKRQKLRTWWLPNLQMLCVVDAVGAHSEPLCWLEWSLHPLPHPTALSVGH